MNLTLKRIWHLACLAVNGSGGKLGLAYCVIILLMGLAEIQISVLFIAWNKDFFDALGKYDVDAAVWQIGVFAVLTAASAGLYLVGTYLRQLLQMRWRTTLTCASLDRWMKNKAYWHLNTTESSPLDNPDQRIAEDCRIFVQRLVGGGSMMGSDGNILDFITGLIGLITYVVLLWELSDFSLDFTLFGQAVSIEHYMVWAAPIYVLISSGLTHWLGAPLMKLNLINQHREADLRFALTHFRESKDAIALGDGEAAERLAIDARYGRILENWRQRIKREFILGCFTRPYFMTVLRIPLFIAFPAYLAGSVALGGLMQLSSAFQKVVTSLSWFIFCYKPLAELAATSNRLGFFLSEAEAAAMKPPSITTVASRNGALHIRDLAIRDPNGKPLLHLPELSIRPGEAVWIDGPSGIGKSTLIKAISGLWRHCGGSIEIPPGKTLFLPQNAYLPLGGLAAAVTYPDEPDDIDAVRALLARVGLDCPRHSRQLDRTDDMAKDHKLSGGEQQRLIIARILAAKPNWVFLDEATSALDAEAERQLYATLRNALPNTGFIVIAHREPRGLGVYRRLDLRESLLFAETAKQRKSETEETAREFAPETTERVAACAG
ncbi:MAG: ATP-binding cassette domain-containing protein [Azoarcus sp.]|jgi:putative ATP-binding cassette transporter|nr:ATP-binding cassette domain-containing protein [Azoarcus sp.]